MGLDGTAPVPVTRGLAVCLDGGLYISGGGSVSVETVSGKSANQIFISGATGYSPVLEIDAGRGSTLTVQNGGAAGGIEFSTGNILCIVAGADAAANNSQVVPSATPPTPPPVSCSVGGVWEGTSSGGNEHFFT